MAIVFSGVAGVLGIIVVAWYGLSGSPEASKPTDDDAGSQSEPQVPGEAASRQSDGSDPVAAAKPEGPSQVAAQ